MNKFKDILSYDNIMSYFFNKYKNIPIRIIINDTNLKFNNLIDVPFEIYLNVNKVILTIQHVIDITDLLEFICMNFKNLEKLKFISVKKDEYCRKNGSFYPTEQNMNYFLYSKLHKININKLALLEKLLYIRNCFANNFIKHRTYGIMSIKLYFGKICSYMENMTIFSLPENFQMPSNIKKLKIMEHNGDCEIIKILSNLKIGLTHLEIKISEFDIDSIFNFMNLPCTIEQFHVLLYVNNTDTYSFEKEINVSDLKKRIKKHKQNIKQIIKLPFGCKLIITTYCVQRDSMSDSEDFVSDDEDFNEFNNFDDIKMYKK